MPDRRGTQLAAGLRRAAPADDHRAMGISDGQVSLPAGLEPAEDLIAALDQALQF